MVFGPEVAGITWGVLSLPSSKQAMIARPRENAITHAYAFVLR